jgi:hypothetical protein
MSSDKEISALIDSYMMWLGKLAGHLRIEKPWNFPNVWTIDFSSISRLIK